MKIQYGLLGETLKHSFSPQIHAQLGNYDYQLIPIPAEDAKNLLERKNFKGLNVTIPYKKMVMPYCDILTDAAVSIGSVNTLVIQNDGKLLGHNTDFDGFLYLAKRTHIDFKNKKVLILGTGGTSLTATAAVKHSQASEVIIASRKGKVNYDNIYNHKDADIIINTTPVGMFPNNGVSLVDLSKFSNLEGVLDVIYNPLKTKLISDAQALGIPASGGLSMLVGQAKYASELFTGTKIPDSRIEEIYNDLLAKLCNIVLIGMPGSGKTTIGSLIAKEFKREFIDLDEYIVQKEGRSIPEIFQANGEEYFRKLETEAAVEIGKKSGIVIACGGGTVLREENVFALKQNGVCIQIKRSLKELALNGRPLSKDLATLEKMAQKRGPFYDKASDGTLLNDKDTYTALKKCKELYYEIIGH